MVATPLKRAWSMANLVGLNPDTMTADDYLERFGITVEGTADPWTVQPTPVAKPVPPNLPPATGPGSRLLKCTCPKCGYLARVTRKWIAEAGHLICPTDKIHLIEA